MNRKEFVRKYAKKTHTKVYKTEKFMSNLEDLIIELIKSGETISISNLSVILRKRNIIEKRTYPEERTLEKIILENNLVKSNCDKNKTKYFEIESDYENDLKKAYKWIYKKMKSDYFLQ